MKNQNTLIQHQMSLEEASRRGALVMLMSNIMDKVDDEIKEQKSDLLKTGISRAAVDTMKFSLSKSLIGQITALSHSFKPYRYLEGGTLIESPLSPERGQLLITLVQIPLDSTTRHQIYLYATFQNADLKDAILNRANLSGLDLNDANFTKSYLIGANLHRTMLKGADLSYANLSNANLEAANMDGAVLKRTILFKANLLASSFVKANLMEAILELSDLHQSTLNGASLIRANLSGADLSGADLLGDEFYNTSDADLSDADFSRANLEATMVSVNQLSRSYSLKYCEGLSDSIRKVLVKDFPHLFTPHN
ncbi:MAG: pentapeptide repeat-containing protein [Saprospiraceae bacterium]|nr:pentapeptide repeat-containing protein [Saprospiraceae bacterium]